MSRQTRNGHVRRVGAFETERREEAADLLDAVERDAGLAHSVRSSSSGRKPNRFWISRSR